MQENDTDNNNFVFNSQVNNNYEKSNVNSEIDCNHNDIDDFNFAQKPDDDFSNSTKSNGNTRNTRTRCEICSELRDVNYETVWKKGTVLVTGDSIVSGLRESKMFKRRLIKVRYFPGASIRDMFLYLYHSYM